MAVTGRGAFPSRSVWTKWPTLYKNHRWAQANQDLKTIFEEWIFPTAEKPPAEEKRYIRATIKGPKVS